MQNKTSLQPGETYTSTITFILPDDKTGTYYLFVFADILNNQPEKDENNNSGVSSAFEIESSPSSNLAAREIKAPLSAFSQTELELSWMVQNTGEWNISGQWTDRIYLSPDKTLNTDDLLLGEFSRTEGMAANTDYWQTEAVQIPKVSVGSYYLIMETDSEKTVNETDEDDNIAVRTITIAKTKLMTAVPDRIMLNLTPGVPVTGQIDITNIGNTAMSGIDFKVQNASPNISIQLNVPPTLGSLASESISYTVTATDQSVLQNEADVLFRSNEGEAGITFEIAVIPAEPRLVVNPGYFESGMLRGEQRTVECEITNTGGAPANDLQVMLPNAEWLQLVTPAYIGSLAQGEKAKIGVSLNPDEDMELGLYTGTIAVSGSNTSLRIGFRFTLVSEAKGSMKVIAKDEFSYFAENHPNVSGAKVSLKDAYGDTVVAEGITDENGIFTAQNINEGHYELTVRAEKHGTYRSPIVIVPAVEKEVEAFMKRQLVTYNWSVVPIQIEDKYKITLEAVFETHVPAPVVTVEPPTQLVPFYEGEIGIANIRITNHGLIAAKQVVIHVPESKNYSFEPLIREIGVLPAMTSIVVPIEVQAKTDGPIAIFTKRSGILERSGEPICDASEYLSFDNECLNFAVCWFEICGGIYCTTFNLKPLKIALDIYNGFSCFALKYPMSCLSLACSICSLDPCICMLVPPVGVKGIDYIGAVGNVISLLECLACGVDGSSSPSGGGGGGTFGGGGGGSNTTYNPCE